MEFFLFVKIERLKNLINFIVSSIFDVFKEFFSFFFCRWLQNLTNYDEVSSIVVFKVFKVFWNWIFFFFFGENWTIVILENLINYRVFDVGIFQGIYSFFFCERLQNYYVECLRCIQNIPPRILPFFFFDQNWTISSYSSKIHCV